MLEHVAGYGHLESAEKTLHKHWKKEIDLIERFGQMSSDIFRVTCVQLF